MTENSLASLYICSLDVLESTCSDLKPSHLVSTINAAKMPETPEHIAPEKHLKLAMNDIHMPVTGLITPAENHVVQLVDFVQSWDRRHPILFHCWAGISRSTAAALISMCVLKPNESEMDHARSLRAASTLAMPNRKLIDLADKYLQRNGQLVQAVKKMDQPEFETGGKMGTVVRIELPE